MNVDNLPPSNDPNIKYKEFSREELKMILREKKLEIKEAIEAGEFKASEHIQENKDLRLIMADFKKDFIVISLNYYYHIRKFLEKHSHCI